MAQKLNKEQVTEKLKLARDNLQPVAFALRDLIERIDNTLTAISAWSFVCYVGKDRVFSIIPYKNWINLQLWNGAELDDPDTLITGTGKRLRHVKCRTLEDATSEKLESLVKRAIAFDQTLETRIKI